MSDSTSANAHQREKNRISSLPWTLTLLTVIVWLESAMLAAWTIWFAIGFLTDRPDSVGGALLLLVLSVVATVWLALAAVGLMKRRTWTRAAVLVWQLCQTAIAAGAFQGLFAAPVVGVALLVPALGAGVLLFTPRVVAALRRDPK